MQMFTFFASRLRNQSEEMRSRIEEQRSRLIEFQHFAVTENLNEREFRLVGGGERTRYQNPIAVDHRSQTMGDGQNGAGAKLFANGSLNPFVRSKTSSRGEKRISSRSFDDLRVIDVRRCFVDDQNATFPQYRSGQTDQLFLSDAQIRSAFVHQRSKSVRHSIDDERFQSDFFQGAPNFRIGKFVEPIEIVSQRSAEENRILRNDRNASSNFDEIERRNVDLIDENSAAAQFRRAKESLDQRTFPSTGASDDADLFSASDGQRNVIERQRRRLNVGIRKANVVENDLTVRRPMDGRRRPFLSSAFALVLQFTILEHAFDRRHLRFHFDRLSTTSRRIRLDRSRNAFKRT